MRLAGILFDKDGTLVDFDRTWGRAADAVMRRMSRGEASVLARLVAAMHFDMDARRFHATSPFIAGAWLPIIEAWGEALDRSRDPGLGPELNDLFAAATLATLTPVGDPVAVLDALRRQGLALGVATNDGEVSARAQLAALGLDRHMDFVAGYDSGHGGKPEPGMVLAFAAVLGVAPNRIALVGDTAHDLAAARAAGAVAIAVLSGPARRDTLAPLADHVIDSIADLPALLPTLA